MEITMQNRFQITPASDALRGLGTHVVFDVKGYYKTVVATDYEEAVALRDALRGGAKAFRDSLRPTPVTAECDRCNSLAAAG